ncbi:hypothetical protein HRR83_009467 [Exophiala dermatitidis]|uniref:Zn(2)-C6 fungal-type domain-containing protein n=3 Tax=Exophiala dermatitidis TaxID=5970 RepID=H6BTW1_EXODN|nr:uncharacterized protein HMPREF1120_03671 [Exophiala dermatitidis NIH/UT8656]KAJ4502570.1 hypothetical protein HRR74_009535 [Exophiala dermatitidis]EHY55538.1 hypothetical protein HMPREF1120_03671 [Exophiala dermatitidis NIH/UT8656]KAJ4510270.1 hypothetical protein HRR73_007068 [Exophiala dermatitidis]KAJ4531511.1 hypothetical protein HRR77_009441 [Exophiala dermatitidis]KAJ4540435.1 hypothetical protein HRR76_003834 [Exophiala dermatitidis]
MFSVLSLGPKKQSHRPSQVCDACRQRKVRCPNATSALPRACHPCARCIRKGWTCTYGEHVDRKHDRPSDGSGDHGKVHSAGTHRSSAALEPFAGTDHSVTAPSNLSMDNNTSPAFPDNALAAFPSVGDNTWPQYQDVILDDFSWNLNSFSQAEATTPINSSNYHSTLQYSNTFPADHDSFPVPYSALESESTIIGSSSPDEDSEAMPMTTTAALHDTYRKDIDRYFELMYMVFPVLDKQEFYDRLASPGVEHDSDFQALLAALRLLCLTADLLIEPSPEVYTAVCCQIQSVENIRSTYDFAETATLDTVVVSLILFHAYGMTSRNNRAMLYLGETCDLHAMVSRVIEEESNSRLLRRLARVDLVIANTQASARPLCGGSNNFLHCRRQSSIKSSFALLEKNLPSNSVEKRADQLLVRLTKVETLHSPSTSTSAAMADELNMVSMTMTDIGDKEEPYTCSAADDDVSSDSLDDMTMFAGRTAMADQCQTANVAITGHWRAIERLYGRVSMADGGGGGGGGRQYQYPHQHEAKQQQQRQPPNKEATRLILRAVSDRCSATLACTSALGEKTLRVIGLAKLSKLVLDSKAIITAATRTTDISTISTNSTYNRHLKNALAGYHGRTVLKSNMREIDEIEVRRTIKKGTSARSVEVPRETRTC